MMQINIFNNFFHIRGNRFANSQKCYEICYHQDIKGVMSMNIKQKIEKVLSKITSNDQLEKIYRYILYIYIHDSK